jgi:peptidoglycan/LPS O-acetylase OafA/YrhL
LLANNSHILEGHHPWSAMLIWLGCTFAVSAINYVLIETPCRKWILSALSAVLAKHAESQPKPRLVEVPETN